MEDNISTERNEESEVSPHSELSHSRRAAQSHQDETHRDAHTSLITDQHLERAEAIIERCLQEVQRVFISEEDHAALAITALLARGHVLLEGIPGVAKTTLARAIAQVIGCPMKRVQFTPDLLPADIVGGSVFNPQLGDFKLLKGPIFTHVLLADEVNRAPAKTQAALLEAMQESQVTLEGESRALPAPFFAIATQNPSEHFGVYPLPEAQLDRFALRVVVGYPSEAMEVGMMHNYQRRPPTCSPCMTPKLVLQLQALADEVFIHPELLKYIVSLARFTRYAEQVKLGISPRACLVLTKLCKARALMRGRRYVIPADIQGLLNAAWSHRVHLTDEALYERVSQAQVIQRALNEVKYHGPHQPNSLRST